MTTIQDLAIACGVSIATVSRAFSPNGKIKADTREMILKRAQELHYVPNSIAKSLQEKQTYTVGLIIPEITNSFYSTVIQEMEWKYRENGYRFIIGFYQPGISTEAQIISDMYSYRTDALIFSPRDRSSESVLKNCFSKNNVLQLFNRTYPEYDSLAIDDVQGIEMATEYLISQGHEKILYFGHPERMCGYSRVMERHGYSASGLCYTDVNLSKEELRRMIPKIAPTAILAVAKYAEKMVSVLYHMGLKIPEEISLIVYDDVEWTKMLDITTVAHPLRELAELSLEMLLERIKNRSEEAPLHRLLLPHLEYRKSVKELKRHEVDKIGAE